MQTGESGWLSRDRIVQNLNGLCHMEMGKSSGGARGGGKNVRAFRSSTLLIYCHVRLHLPLTIVTWTNSFHSLEVSLMACCLADLSKCPCCLTFFRFLVTTIRASRMFDDKIMETTKSKVELDTDLR